jgi:hypothetical protein
MKNVLFVLALIGLILYSMHLLGVNIQERFVQGTCPDMLVGNARVQFLSGRETAKFLMEDPDEYVEHMTPTDLYARGAKTVDGYKLACAKVAVDFTPDQKEKYVRAARDADEAFMRMGHEIIEAIQWVFAKTRGDAYEDGWPHTRANIIFVSTDMDADSHGKLVKTLVHEKLHLFQRAYPEKMAQLLDSTGYIRWKYRVGEPRVRANPDIDPWIYVDSKTQKPMMARYNSDTPADLSDIDVAPEDEHPFERMAYEVAAKA